MRCRRSGRSAPGWGEPADVAAVSGDGAVRIDPMPSTSVHVVLEALTASTDAQLDDTAEILNQTVSMTA